MVLALISIMYVRKQLAPYGARTIFVLFAPMPTPGNLICAAALALDVEVWTAKAELNLSLPSL
jgi:hypothetical protein